MINGIIFEERDNAAKNWGSIFKNMFPQDGVLNGCEISASASTVTIAPGHFVLCGRILENDGSHDIPIEINVQAGYVRLIYRIDLGIAPEESPGTFSQGSITVDFSATSEFQSLTQQDLNKTGLIYEQELAVYQIVGGAISVKIRDLPPAAYNGVVLRNEAGMFEIFREQGFVRFTTKPYGGTEVTAIKINDDGKTEFTGSFDIKGDFGIVGNITSQGSALFTEKIGLLGAEDTFQFKWGSEDGTGVVNLGFGLDSPIPIKSMTFFPSGAVTIPQAVPQYNDDLIMNANVIFTLQNKGIVSSATGVEKNLLIAMQSGDLLVGASDNSNTGADTIIRARDSVALRPYQSAEGHPVFDALIARWNLVEINTPLTVSGLLKASGGLEIAGAFKTTGLEASNISITDAVSINNAGSSFTKPVVVDALLTASKGLTVAGAFNIDAFTANTMTVKNALVVDGILSANKGASITGSITQEASGTAVFGIGMGIKESSGKQFMIRYPDTGAKDYVNLSFIDGNHNTLRIRSDGTVESGGTFKAGVNSYGAAALEVSQESVNILKSMTAVNISVTGALSAAVFNPTRIETNSMFIKNANNENIFAVSNSITAYKNLTVQADLTAVTGLAVTAGNIVQGSPQDYKYSANFGCEMSIRGTNSNRLSVRYPNSGNSDTAGVYIRTGANERTALQIDQNGKVSFPNGIGSVSGGLSVSGTGSFNILHINSGMIRQGTSGKNITIYGDTAGAKPGVEIAYDTGVVSLPTNNNYTTTSAANVFMSSIGSVIRSTSSRRYKENIIDADTLEIIDTLQKLKVRNFTSKCESDDQTKIRTGGIAEEFAEIDERLALIDESGLIQAIDTSELLYRLLSGWQENNKKIERLEQEIFILKNK